MIFSCLGIVFIYFYWDENTATENLQTYRKEMRHKMSIENEKCLDNTDNISFLKSASLYKDSHIQHKKKTFKDLVTGLKESFNELKKKDVLYIGIIESITASSWGLFFFSWTPILNSLSPNNHVNVGFVYICFVMALIGGAMLYEIFLIKLKKNYYKTLLFSCIIQIISFLGVAVFSSFYIVLCFLAIINSLIGFTSPLFSIIKSVIIQEKYRSQLMSIFRVPLSIYVCILLLLTHYFSSSTVSFYL